MARRKSCATSCAGILLVLAILLAPETLLGCEDPATLPTGLRVVPRGRVYVPVKPNPLQDWSVVPSEDAAYSVLVTVTPDPFLRILAVTSDGIRVADKSVRAPGHSFCVVQEPRGSLWLAWANADPQADPRTIHPFWLREAKWDGRQWSGQRDLPGTTGKAAPVACRDASGMLHIVCQGALDPPENYHVGFDSYRPQKFYHLFRTANGDWSVPAPVVGRSRWDYHTIRLTSDPNGPVHLVAEAKSSNRLGYGPSIIEHRTLRDGKWSGPDRVADSDPFVDMHDPSLAVDGRGDLHLVYSVFFHNGRGPFPDASRYRVKRGGVWQSPEPVGHEGFHATTGNDRKGRVYLAWEEKDPATGHHIMLKVRDGPLESETLTFPGSTDTGFQFYETPEGGLGLSWLQGTEIVIQPVDVQH